jgi:hypothetical protein
MSVKYVIAFICDLGYTSGTRFGDVTTLTTLQFLNITVETHEQLMDFPLIVEGKMVTRSGGSARLACSCHSDVHQRGARSKRTRGKETGRQGYYCAISWSCIQQECRQADTRSAIQKMFALACIKTGITGEG